MALYIYCPHTKECDFYQNWEGHREEKRIDVIGGKKEKEYCEYDCLALRALNEDITPMSDELKNRLPVPEKPHICLYITQLNLLAEVNNKLKNLSIKLEKE